MLVPDVAWRAGAFQADLAVALGADGRIAGLAPAAQAGPGAERIPGRALLPGFVNGHSHAFQRLLRGRAQWRAAGADADFWSWRGAMLAVAASLSPDDVLAASRFAFLEMLHAGFTAVGEFHYLRRDPAGEPYADVHEIADHVVRAARDAGIRVTLLDAAYAAGSFGAPLEPGQRRFATPDVDRFLSDLDAFRARWRDDPAVLVGTAAHSVRTVPVPFLGPLAEWSRERGAPLHAHASEQPGEVAACVAATGRRPVELLADEGAVTAGFTAVHAIHLQASEVALLGRAAAGVCACPTTERDLGDGILPSAELAAAGASISLGSDSHVVIDPFEEMRALEGHQRLRSGRRVVHGGGAGERHEAAPALLAAGTENGARALGIEAGRIEPGRWADLVAVDLGHPALAGWGPETLAAHLALAGPAGAVTDVWVAGERLVTDGRHRLDEEAAAQFTELARRCGAPAGAS